MAEQTKSNYYLHLTTLLENDLWRMEALRLVSKISGDRAWIGGGFIRHLVWDHLSGRDPHRMNDIDVIYMGNENDAREELIWEKELKLNIPELKWSVKEQTRMARLHGHAPYVSVEDSLSFWVEKCTAVAVRYFGGNIEILAPFGLEDLFEGIISPTRRSYVPLLKKRMEEKKWLREYPFLIVNY